MDNRFIAVLDSGVGGLSVLCALQKKFPFERFLYFGDNGNAPYGSRSIRNLLSITIKNIDYIKSYGLKAIVVACNTLSVNIIYNIREYSNLPVFGIFPPVERCVAENKKTPFRVFYVSVL